ncbi:hypothetical protein Gotri_027646, partial [Gossypium trilobum]|nr:hypothetical protein [Gossypium trilobum]
GLSWRVGKGNNVSIWTDRWIPGIEPSTWQNGDENRELKTIPLAETDSEDLCVWKGKPTGEFSNAMKFTTSIKNSAFGLADILELYSYTSQPTMQANNHKREMPSLWLRGRGQFPCIPAMPYNYLVELEEAGKEKYTLKNARIQRLREEITEDTILFNASFDTNRSRSASGVIAIKLGISLGLRLVTIRGDSKTVIKKCQSSETDKSIIGAVINDIKSHSTLFQEIGFQFIQKSENFQAHKITKETLANGEERYLIRDESIYNEGAMEEEWSRNPD